MGWICPQDKLYGSVIMIRAFTKEDTMKLHSTNCLYVITGPMFAGKTEELIRQIKLVQVAGKNVKIFKPKIDVRSGGAIKSRNGHNLPAIEVEKPEDIPSFIEHGDQVIAIDEAHFFSKELISVVVQLYRSGRFVIVSGLDLDFEEKPFETIAPLLCLAEKVFKLKSVCEKCKTLPASATRSQRLVKSEERFLVGSSEYVPRCTRCYEPPSP